MNNKLHAFLASERKLLEAATLGPWYNDRTNSIYQVGDAIQVAECCVVGDIDEKEDLRMQLDGDFIANVRTSHALALDALEIAMQTIENCSNSTCMHGDADSEYEYLKDSAKEAIARIEEILNPQSGITKQEER